MSFAALELGRARKILLLGAHADDIEIGCGGTVLKLLAKNPKLEVMWVVFSAEGARNAEAKASAKAYLRGVARADVQVKDFRGSFFPYEGEKIKQFFESLKSFGPDVVFTHYRDDRHQDHRVISDLTWNTFRDHLVLEYEIPKYDGDLGSPNFFVQVDDRIAKKKTKLLGRFFKTQGNKHWFSDDTFLALMRLRGMECCARYAEAYYCRKMVFH